LAADAFQESHHSLQAALELRERHSALSVEGMDTVSGQRRSEIMSAVRGRGNRSTEWRLRAALVRCGIRGWKLHYPLLPGNPDFAFPRERLAVFVDGCFWHGCPRCGRQPKTNREFWRTKILGNVARDRRKRAHLRRLGWRVIRVWEHDFKDQQWLLRLREALDERGCLGRALAGSLPFKRHPISRHLHLSGKASEQLPPTPRPLGRATLPPRRPGSA